jgi:acyl-CoA thioesterase-1
MRLNLQRSILLLMFICTLSDAGESDRSSPVILLLGDSLTAGYGINREEAYPALLREKIHHMEWRAEVIDAGISGTTTAGGIRLLDWHLRRHIDIIVIALGGNDGLRGISPSESKANLEQIIIKARKTYPAITIILAGMMAPPNMGESYGAEFHQIYHDIAANHNAALIPFLLQGVGGHPEMNLADGIHPNPAGHKIIADLVWNVLMPILEKFQGIQDTILE